MTRLGEENTNKADQKALKTRLPVQGSTWDIEERTKQMTRVMLEVVGQTVQEISKGN